MITLPAAVSLPAPAVATITEKEEIITRAAELGIELTAADFEQKQELSDDELDAVAGGKAGGCGCPLLGGGGGKDEDNGKTYGCGCVGYGQGGDGKLTDFNCCCMAGGYGADKSYLGDSE